MSRSKWGWAGSAESECEVVRDKCEVLRGMSAELVDPAVREDCDVLRARCGDAASVEISGELASQTVPIIPAACALGVVRGPMEVSKSVGCLSMMAAGSDDSEHPAKLCAHTL